MTSTEILDIILAGMACVALIAFLLAHRAGGRYENFHLLDLITSKEGRIDRPSLMEFTVFVLMCWGFVVFVQRDKLPEWFLTMFVGAFVLRSAYSAWLRTSADKDGGKPTRRADTHAAPPLRKDDPP